MNYFEWSRQRSGARMAFRNILLPKSPERFTSVFPVPRTFGMGTGPSSQLWPPAPKTTAFRRIIKHSQTSLRFTVTRIGMTSVTSDCERNLLQLSMQAAREAVETAGARRIDAMQLANKMSVLRRKRNPLTFPSGENPPRKEFHLLVVLIVDRRKVRTEVRLQIICQSS